MEYMRLCQHDGLKKLWQTELEMQNRDYSIAMKIPHYMKAAGLKNVSCRMNDRVNYLEPDQPEYEEARRLLNLLDYFVSTPGEEIPKNSILREFIGGSYFNV